MRFIGGGTIGCELGLDLGEEGKDVSIIEMGNDSLYAEIFETRIDTSDKPEYVKELCNLKGSYDFEVKPTWYEDILYKESIHKKAKKKNSKDLDEVTKKFFDTYLKWSKEAKACDVNLKKQKAKVYTEGLLSNGGPSTDVFVKAKGREYTEELFRTKLFGTEQINISPYKDLRILLNI